MELLAQIASAGGPSVLAVWAFYLLLRRDLREVQEDIRDLRDDYRSCNTERRASEAELHDRCTANATELARLKGRLNGANHGI